MEEHTLEAQNKIKEMMISLLVIGEELPIIFPNSCIISCKITDIYKNYIIGYAEINKFDTTNNIFIKAEAIYLIHKEDILLNEFNILYCRDYRYL